MKHTFNTAPKAARDKTTGAIYTPVSTKATPAKAEPTAAKGDDEVMSTPAKTL